MKCNNTQNLLIDFIEGNIPDDFKVQVEEHLLTCKTCRIEHKQTRQLLDDMLIFEDEQPEEKLKVDFYTMLEKEKEQLHAVSTKSYSLPKHIKFNGNYIKYAASVIILLSIGFYFGQHLQIRSQQNSEIAALRSELQIIQQNASMVSLSQPTASQRLKAINLINDQVESDQKTINILINTFKNDDNINVRMAAANALSRYSDNEDVRNIFISVLNEEKDPALQITLINLLTQIQEARAKKTFEKILNDANTYPVVKEQVQQGLKVFV